MRSLTRKTAFGAVGVLAAIGVTGTAWAETGSGSSPTSTPAASTNPTATPSATKPAKHRARGLLERADHANAEIKVKGQWVTYTLDRGTVTAVSPSSITLSRPDGQSVTDSISAQTKFKGVASASAVRVGQPAQIVSDNGAALRVRQKAA
ncbi:MAG TPA: hypothetical protein VG435_06930 [Acidimicrobiales bacterium]|jgi:hypothetical protein|nr:hypothetical protein [Acidimicrobiales bacterium]